MDYLLSFTSAAERLAEGLGFGFILAFFIILFLAVVTWDSYRKEATELRANTTWLHRIANFIHFDPEYGNFMIPVRNQEKTRERWSQQSPQQLFQQFNYKLDEIAAKQNLHPYCHFMTCDKSVSHGKNTRPFVKRGNSNRKGLAIRTYLFYVHLSFYGNKHHLNTDSQLTRVQKELLLRPQSRITFLGAILPGIAISVGLYGTITGMFKVFKNATGPQLTDVSQLGNMMTNIMGALSEAMFSTAIALIISIALVLISTPLKMQLQHIYLQLQEIHQAVQSKL